MPQQEDLSVVVHVVEDDLTPCLNDMSNEHVMTSLDTLHYRHSSSNFQWPLHLRNLWNKLNPSIRIKLAEVKFPHWPLVTCLVLTTVWLSYIYGICFMLTNFGGSTSSGSIWMSESPPQEALVFRSVSQWPQCTDARVQAWRLLSFQIVHASLIHIIGNTVFGLTYGMFLENIHSFGLPFTAVSYFGGVLSGAMGFAYVWPYGSLVGCSCGIYSMIGTTLGLLLVNRDDKKNYHVKLTCISVIVCLTLAIELIMYFTSYDPTVGYASHICGTIFGLLWGLSAGVVKQDHLWKLIVGYTSLSFLVAYLIIVVVFYTRPWPLTAPFWNPTFEAGYNPLSTCCARLHSLERAHPNMSAQSLMNRFECNMN